MMNTKIKSTRHERFIQQQQRQRQKQGSSASYSAGAGCDDGHAPGNTYETQDLYEDSYSTAASLDNDEALFSDDPQYEYAYPSHRRHSRGHNNTRENSNRRRRNGTCTNNGDDYDDDEDDASLSSTSLSAISVLSMYTKELSYSEEGEGEEEKEKESNESSYAYSKRRRPPSQVITRSKSNRHRRKVMSDAAINSFGVGGYDGLDLVEKEVLTSEVLVDFPTRNNCGSQSETEIELEYLEAELSRLKQQRIERRLNKAQSRRRPYLSSEHDSSANSLSLGNFDSSAGNLLDSNNDLSAGGSAGLAEINCRIMSNNPKSQQGQRTKSNHRPSLIIQKLSSALESAKSVDDELDNKAKHRLMSKRLMSSLGEEEIEIDCEKLEAIGNTSVDVADLSDIVAAFPNIEATLSGDEDGNPKDKIPVVTADVETRRRRRGSRRNRIEDGSSDEESVASRSSIASFALPLVEEVKFVGNNEEDEGLRRRRRGSRRGSEEPGDADDNNDDDDQLVTSKVSIASVAFSAALSLAGEINIDEGNGVGKDTTESGDDKKTPRRHRAHYSASVTSTDAAKSITDLFSGKSKYLKEIEQAEERFRGSADQAEFHASMLLWDASGRSARRNQTQAEGHDFVCTDEGVTQNGVSENHITGYLNDMLEEEGGDEKKQWSKEGLEVAPNAERSERTLQRSRSMEAFPSRRRKSRRKRLGRSKSTVSLAGSIDSLDSICVNSEDFLTSELAQKNDKDMPILSLLKRDYDSLHSLDAQETLHYAPEEKNGETLPTIGTRRSSLQPKRPSISSLPSVLEFLETELIQDKDDDEGKEIGIVASSRKELSICNQVTAGNDDGQGKDNVLNSRNVKDECESVQRGDNQNEPERNAALRREISRNVLENFLPKLVDELETSSPRVDTGRAGNDQRSGDMKKTSSLGKLQSLFNIDDEIIDTGNASFPKNVTDNSTGNTRPAHNKRASSMNLIKRLSDLVIGDDDYDDGNKEQETFDGLASINFNYDSARQDRIIRRSSLDRNISVIDLDQDSAFKQKGQGSSKNTSSIQSQSSGFFRNMFYGVTYEEAH